jgi:hypothetical protein
MTMRRRTPERRGLLQTPPPIPELFEAVQEFRASKNAQAKKRG